VPFQCARHGTTMCQSVVRLADGTTWHNSIIVGWFLLLRKQIFMFFGTVRTQKDEKWGIFNITWACRRFPHFFFSKRHFICTCISWALYRAVPGTSIWKVVLWHKLWRLSTNNAISKVYQGAESSLTPPALSRESSTSRQKQFQPPPSKLDFSKSVEATSQNFTS